MDFNSKFNLLFLLSLMFGFVFTSKRGYQAAQEEPSCLPIHSLLIWHINSGEDASFFQQRRLIVQLMTDFPQDTNVSLVTIGAAKKDMSFKKEDTVMNVIPRNTGNHKIPYLKISSAIFNYFEKHENLKTAEEVFLVVNNNSAFDDEDSAIQVLEKKKTFIVLSGKHTDNAMKVWTNVATDKRHLIVLGDSKESIKDAVELLLSLSCQDSKLFCDTDQYWTGTRCFRCSYICSYNCKNPSLYCLQTCPYFCHSPLDTDSAVENQNFEESVPEENVPHYFLNTGLIIIVIIFLFVVYFLYKRRKKILTCIRLKGKNTSLSQESAENTSLIAEEENHHSELDTTAHNRTHSITPDGAEYIPYFSSVQTSESETGNEENTYNQVESIPSCSIEDQIEPTEKTSSLFASSPRKHSDPSGMSDIKLNNKFPINTTS